MDYNAICISNIWYLAKKDKANPIEHRDTDVSTIPPLSTVSFEGSKPISVDSLINLDQDLLKVVKNFRQVEVKV